jgi:DNA-binding beta-propeller fold protein YncE
VFVADSGNHRIVVFDADKGTYKRHWFAYGEKAAGAAAGPYDPNAPAAKSFRDVTCVEIAKDGMVYVCDKSSNRIQVFDKTGKFVNEGDCQSTRADCRRTAGAGSTRRSVYVSLNDPSSGSSRR